MPVQVNPHFWYGKKVFLTGHTGFKGSWLSLWLQSMGVKLKGFALNQPTTPSLFEEARIGIGMDSEIGDIRDFDTILASITKFNPDILIHMAAQPLVRPSYLKPIETYATNVMGTVNILEAARKCHNLKAIINVTSDKCYENREWSWGYREIDPMGGHDPYSNSKGCSELVTAAYRKSFFNIDGRVALASARSGNVIGGGDWASDRLIPDILRAFETRKSAVIRNPLATRPWQHVLEPLGGYLVLAEKLYNKGTYFAESWNFGPFDKDVLTVKTILDKLVKRWGDGVDWQIDEKPQPHEAQLLKLDISKASALLDWHPRWSIDDTLDKVVEWHRSWLSGMDIQQVTLKQINDYQAY